MPNDESWFDEADDELSDDEYLENDDSDDETATAVCPHCGADVYEDAEYCPICDNYITITSSDNPFLGRPLWWILLGLAGVVATFAALAGFLPW